MKSVFSIYLRDLRRAFTNPAAAVILLGLVGLPSLYAWFNIEASWDPYAQTGGIAIAVANEDKGTTIRGTPVNVGKEIAAKLADNPSVGWTFAGRAEAMRGVKHGDYYAAIVIPDNFSASLATILASEPSPATLDYYVNEKINAIAPKITSKGATGIVQEVSQSFVETASGILFGLFNEAGSELEASLPSIERVKTLLFKLEAAFPEINAAADTAQRDVGLASGVVAQAQKRLPDVAALAAKGQTLAEKTGALLGQSRTALAQMGPQIKQDLLSLQQLAGAARSVTALLQAANPDLDAAASAATGTAKRLRTGADLAGHLGGLLTQLDAMSGASALSTPAARLKQAQAGMLEQAKLLEGIADAAGRGEAPAEALAGRLNALAGEGEVRLGELLGAYDGEIAPRIDAALGKAAAAADTAQAVLKDASAAMPDAKRVLADAASALTLGGAELTKAKAELPAAQRKIGEIADKIRAFEKENNLADIIKLLRHDAQRESAFFAAPVSLKENKLYPIPNYGSAMSPFFTTLSLWVGAVLLVSVMTVDVDEPGVSYRSRHVYFGRYLTLGTLAVLQSLCVTLGDIYVLGAYVARPGWFVLFGMLLSAVFMLIVYTLVSVFGNVGKALAIVMLVLQLGGAGGTFPVQMAPPFFQKIHPYLPFTYAISMMREAVGGILWDIVRRCLAFTAAYAAAALVLGLALKRPINRLLAASTRKAKESRLLH
ncbi:YhgE/Pip domain-containing protein [Cohnella sp. GbtcB17]|uniref:YhgE/Pip domain-containing protein n=1 Tax=Cohnella sp. GbtcB17 TaxID=2824762 RepID=UPI001C306229|nr:YhgE/Pip domain-containing protein [Cohnella sp. GbtcB17]